MNNPYETIPDWHAEPPGLQPGDRVIVRNVYHAQGTPEPEKALDQILTIQGVNYYDGWLYGQTDNGIQIGLNIASVEKIT